MNILDNAKEIAELVKKYNDQELYQRIVSLRSEILDLREETLLLREQVRTLETRRDVSEKLRRDANVYYLETEAGESRGPYCMTCWDYDSKLVNLRVNVTNFNGIKKKSTNCAICAARRSSK